MNSSEKSDSRFRPAKHGLRSDRGSEKQVLTSVQKLDAILNEALQQCEEFGIEPKGKFRFRGDILEVFIDKSKLAEIQSCRDRVHYITLGTLISVLISKIEKAGYHSIIQTFPRFDEPNLIAFVHLGIPIPGGAPAPIVKNRLSYIQQKAEFRNHLIYTIHDSGQANQIIRELNPPSNNTDDAATRNMPLLIAASRQDSPVTWLQSGFLLAETLLCGYSENKSPRIYGIECQESNLRNLNSIKQIVEPNWFVQFILDPQSTANPFRENP